MRLPGNESAAALSLITRNTRIVEPRITLKLHVTHYFLDCSSLIFLDKPEKRTVTFFRPPDLCRKIEGPLICLHGMTTWYDHRDNGIGFLNDC